MRFVSALQWFGFWEYGALVKGVGQGLQEGKGPPAIS